MKKFISLLAVLFLFTIAANSQVIVTSTSAYTDASKSTRVKGWLIRPEIGGGIPLTTEDPDWEAEVLVNAGYQINPFFYVGGGAGIFNTSCNPFLNNDQYHGNFISIYANGRAYITNKKFSPYFDLKIGYAFRDTMHFNRDEAKSNLLCLTGFGVNYKNFDFGLSASLLNMALIARRYDYEYDYYYEYESDDNQPLQLGVLAYISYSIPLRIKR